MSFTSFNVLRHCVTYKFQCSTPLCHLQVSMFWAIVSLTSFNVLSHCVTHNFQCSTPLCHLQVSMFYATVSLTSFNVLRHCVTYMRACGQVDRALESRSEGLGFDSQCWPCVEVSAKLCIPHCLGPPSRNGYLVHRSKVGSIVAGCRRRPLPGGR